MFTFCKLDQAKYLKKIMFSYNMKVNCPPKSQLQMPGLAKRLDHPTYLDLIHFSLLMLKICTFKTFQTVKK